MGAYSDNLRHVAEPAAPSERDKAVSATLADYEAIWFAEALREFAHYAEHEHDDQGGIAVAYASFIDKKVRDEGRTFVELYAHTPLAADTLLDALYENCPEPGERDDYETTVFRSVEGTLAEAFAHHVDDPEAPESPPEPQVVELDGEESVVFDADEARESIAIKQMEEAESEALAKAEAEAEKRGIDGRKTPRVDPRRGHH